MCLSKKIRTKIDTLQETVNKLQKTIETNELARLRNVQKEFDKTTEELKNIKLKVKSIKYSEEDRTVIVNYEAPSLVIEIDELGKPKLNKTFRSINLLNLVGTEDFEKIQNILKKIKPLS